MSKVNFGVKFTTSKKASDRGMKFKSKISYNARKEAVQNNNETFIDGYLIRSEALANNKNSFKEYNKENPAIYMTSKGIVRKSDKSIIHKNEKMLDDAQEKGSSLYQSFISFEKEFYQKNIHQKYSEDEFMEKLDPIFNNFLTDNGFYENNVEYFATIHTNKDHFHLHFDFVEKNPKKTKNQLEIKKIQNMKKQIIQVFDNDLHNEMIDKNEKLKQSKEEYRKKIKKISDNDIKETSLVNAIIKYQQKPVRYFADIEDEELKDLINEVREELISKSDISEMHNEYVEILEEQEQFNKELYGNTTRNQKSNQIDEIEKVINNRILKIIKLNTTEVNKTSSNILEGISNQFIKDNVDDEIIEKISNKLGIEKMTKNEVVEEITKINLYGRNNNIIQEELNDMGIINIKKYVNYDPEYLPKRINIQETRYDINRLEGSFEPSEMKNFNNKENSKFKNINRIEQKIDYNINKLKNNAKKKKYERDKEEEQFIKNINKPSYN